MRAVEFGGTVNLDLAVDAGKKNAWTDPKALGRLQTAIRETTSAIEVWKRLVPQDNSLTVPASIAAILPPSPFQSAAFSPAETDTAVAAG